MAVSPSTQLQPKSVSVKELMKSAYFEIPPNQREYRWESEQRNKLWSDLISCINSDFSSKGGEGVGHFLGAIVAIGGDQSLPESRWEVIDGQQRLTTITILAESLRPYAEEHSHKRTSITLTHMLTDCVYSPGLVDSPRMKLNRENEFYHESIMNHDSISGRREYWKEAFNKKSEVQCNIKDAFEFFDAKVKEYIEERSGGVVEEKDEAISDLVEALTENFYVLIVRARNFMLAYRLFETLNERGLDLSQADLIKNILLQHAQFSGDKSFNNVVLNWSYLNDNYEEQPAKKLSIPQIIQFSYSYRHELVKGEKIFDYISLALDEGRHTPVELSREFSIDSQNWVSFLLGDLVNWDDKIAAHQYAIIDPLWKAHCVPVILAAMDVFSGSSRELGECFMLVEHYLFRRGLVGRDSVAALQEVFGEAAEIIRESKDVNELSAFFKEKSPDRLFVEEFKVGAVRNMKQAFYTVWKIENYLFKGLSLQLESQSAAQHLEHILPRKPGPEWGGIEQEDSFHGYLNRFGNFLILPSEVNQHVKNKPVEYKISNDSKKDYKHSEYRLVKEFVDDFSKWSKGKKWDFEAIERRQKNMAESYAASVWSLSI